MPGLDELARVFREAPARPAPRAPAPSPAPTPAPPAERKVAFFPGEADERREPFVPGLEASPRSVPEPLLSEAVEEGFAEGRAVLRGASGAAAAVLTAAQSLENASGWTLADGASDQVVATFTCPTGRVAVLTGWWARPWSTLGYKSGHVTFALRVGGAKRMAHLPTRLLGVKRDLVRASYLLTEGQVAEVLATNASTATPHAVEAYMEVRVMTVAEWKRRGGAA